MDYQGMREAAGRRLGQMWDTMRRHEKDWVAYRDNFAPSCGRFGAGDQTEGSKKAPRRRNSAPYKIAEEFAAGMQSGLASPGRNWFKLALFNQRMATIERVKAWLGQAEEITAARMAQTNFYDQFVDFSFEQGVFGTAAMFIEADDEDVFYCKTLTAGTYAIDTDYRGKVNRFARKLSYTAQQLEEDFGIEALPREIQEELRDRARRGSDSRHEVAHLIQPNGKYQADDLGPAGFKYQSLWWLTGSDKPEFLRVSGYNEFPVVVGRWKTIGEDIYGRKHPGEMALDDAATLQNLETDSRGALQRTVTPPLLAPASLRYKVDNRPKGTTWYELQDMNQNGPPVIQNLYSVNFNFEAAEAKADRLIGQIERTFYVDLFRMWSSFRRQGVTATQVNAEEAEKSYILAPITLRQTSDVLDKAIQRIFAIMSRAGMYPPVPDELKHVNMRIEYVSEFAMLQKQASQGGIETLLYFAAKLAELQGAAGKAPDVLDGIDMDEVMEVISQINAIPAGVILGDDKVAAIREDRAMQTAQAQMAQMAAQAAEMAPGMAKAAKDMSQTPAGQDFGGAGMENALGAFAGAVDGGGAA
jgi:hypothetical protein